MAGTGLRNGPANGTGTWTSMKMLENQLMAACSHPILAGRPEDQTSLNDLDKAEEVSKLRSP
jgi:hypothetical protein